MNKDLIAILEAIAESILVLAICCLVLGLVGEIS